MIMQNKPIKDTIKADNSTYSSNKIEELVAGASGELPTVTPEDEGKVLTVGDAGEWTIGDVENDTFIIEVDTEYKPINSITVSDLETLASSKALFIKGPLTLRNIMPACLTYIISGPERVPAILTPLALNLQGTSIQCAILAANTAVGVISSFSYTPKTISLS